MRYNRKIVIITALIVMAIATWVSAANTIDQRGVLSGRVLANQLTSPGASVREGDILVMVETITGSAPAVRANTDGRVSEVLVRPGDTIRTGEVMVRIDPSQR